MDMTHIFKLYDIILYTYYASLNIVNYNETTNFRYRTKLDKLYGY